MATKIAAARIAGSAGCATLIAFGGILQPLSHLAGPTGARFTLIRPQASLSAAYKAWIAGTVAPGRQADARRRRGPRPA